VCKGLRVHQRLPALLLQTRHREAMLPDGALLSTAMCLSETELLQPLLRSSQVLCSGSGCVLCSRALRVALLPGSGRLLCSGALRRSSLLCSGSVCGGSRLLRSGGRSGLLRSVAVCGSSVLRSSEVLCSGSGCVLCSRALRVALLPGSGLLCSGALRRSSVL
jgi:hypothetical protein